MKSLTDAQITRILAAKKRWLHAAAAIRRRARQRAKSLCINGSSHGAPEPGKTKCTACLEVHRKSNKAAR